MRTVLRRDNTTFLLLMAESVVPAYTQLYIHNLWVCECCFGVGEWRGGGGGGGGRKIVDTLEQTRQSLKLLQHVVGVE